MFASWYAFSVALFGVALGLDLDVNSADSIKSAAKTLASGIVAAYDNRDDKDNSFRGLWSDTGKPYYFWESGAVWNALLEYRFLTTDSQFDDRISFALLFQGGDGDNDGAYFMPVNQTKTLGNDDQSMWALAAMTAAETTFNMPQTESGTWADRAIGVWNNLVERWDTSSCGGGLRWQIFSFNNGYNYKETMSNGNFFLLSARLAKFTGNETYSIWAEQAFKWAQDVGLISSSWAVFDGTDSIMNCSSVNHIQWAKGSAIYLEGAAIMYNLTNGKTEWQEAVTGFVNQSSVFQKDSTLFEVACEPSGKCNVDQRAFKGLAARSYARAALSAPFVADSIGNILQTSAKAAAGVCDGENTDLACALGWTGTDTAKIGVMDGGLGEAFSALEVVQALMWADGQGNLANSSNANATTTPSGSATGTGAPAQNTNGANTVGSSLAFVFVVAAMATFLL